MRNDNVHLDTHQHFIKIKNDLILKNMMPKKVASIPSSSLKSVTC